MTVYFDAAIHPWKGKMWCHLIADSAEELHAFAEKLGMKRCWYQTKSILPHYDITKAKSEQAAKMGAVFITRRALCDRIALMGLKHCASRCLCHRWGAWKCAECAPDHVEKSEPPERVPAPGEQLSLTLGGGDNA